jgi:dihydroneopterin aldolase
MPADFLRLKNMVFHGYHGYWDEERRVGQRFEVDVELTVEVAQAAQTDHIRDTVDLYKVYQAVEKVVTGKRFKLVETLAEKIASVLLRRFAIRDVHLCVRKPNSPVPGICDGIEVEIFRERGGRNKKSKSGVGNRQPAG